MYKKGIYKVTANTPLTREVYRMVLEGDTQWIKRPGQFVNIELEGLYLRRHLLTEIIIIVLFHFVK